MKREILFRGFNECGNGTQIAVVNGKEYRGEWVEGCYVYDNNLNHHIRAFDNCYYAVIPETVGQWTGLTDKNGTKIFEGDILKSNYVNFIVKPTINGWGLFRYDNGRIGRLSSMQYIHKYEVIGTIFDKEGV